MFSCDKTPNPDETKGLNVSGCCPPAALHYQLSVSRLRSVSPITTRSFLSPNNYLMPPSQTILFVLNFRTLSVNMPCANVGSDTHAEHVHLVANVCPFCARLVCIIMDPQAFVFRTFLIQIHFTVC